MFGLATTTEISSNYRGVFSRYRIRSQWREACMYVVGVGISCDQYYSRDYSAGQFIDWIILYAAGVRWDPDITACMMAAATARVAKEVGSESCYSGPIVQKLSFPSSQRSSSARVGYDGCRIRQRSIPSDDQNCAVLCQWWLQQHYRPRNQIQEVKKADLSDPTIGTSEMGIADPSPQHLIRNCGPGEIGSQRVDLGETAQVPETDEIATREPKKLLEAKTNFKVQQRACSVLGCQNPLELMKHKDLAFSVSRYAANIARHAAYWAKLVAESAVIAARKLCWQPTTQSTIRQVQMFRELELRYQCVGHGTGRDEAAVIREQACEYRQW